MKEGPLPTNVTIDQDNLTKGAIRNLDEDRLIVNLSMNDNRVACFRT